MTLTHIHTHLTFSQVHHPIDYARVVKRIGNEMDLTLVNLDDMLPAATVMVGVSFLKSDVCLFFLYGLDCAAGCGLLLSVCFFPQMVR